MNNTLMNGLAIMERLASSPETFSVKELAESFRLPPSHVCRLLKTLVETGYVEREARTRRYRISLQPLRLANACLRRLGVRDRVRPYLDKLARELDQAAYLMVPHEGEALIVDVLYPGGRGGDQALAIGQVNPLHASAGGKALAAYLPEAELAAAMARLGLPQLGPATITDPERFRAELEWVRRERLALMDRERGESAAVAAPVFNCQGECVAAVGTTLPSGERSGEIWSRFGETVREAAQAASFALGYALASLK